MKKEIHPWVKSEREFYEKKFSQLTDKLNLSSSNLVLDYGSGTGGFASLLAEYNPHLKIIAIDSNPEAIKLGKEHYSHLPNLEFRVGDSIPEGEYDLIINNLVLHELDETENRKTIESFLKRAYKRLKKNGLISVIENRKISQKEFKNIYEKNQSPNKKSFQEEYDEHNSYTTEDWLAMLEGTKFNTQHKSELPPNLFHYIGKK